MSPLIQLLWRKMPNGFASSFRLLSHCWLTELTSLHHTPLGSIGFHRFHQYYGVFRSLSVAFVFVKRRDGIRHIGGWSSVRRLFGTWEPSVSMLAESHEWFELRGREIKRDTPALLLLDRFPFPGVFPPFN